MTKVFLNWWIGYDEAHYFRSTDCFFMRSARSACGKVSMHALEPQWRHATDSDRRCLLCLKEEAKDLEDY